MKRMKFFSKAKPKANKDSSISNEVYGLIVFCLSLMLFLAIMSFHQADPTLFQPQIEGNNYQIQNFLGRVGATIAMPVFVWTFGYAALVFPLLLMTVGIFMMLDQPLAKLKNVSILALCWAFFISIVLALPESLRSGGHTRDYYPSGFIGAEAADAVCQFMGKFALGFLSAVYLLILLMVTFRIRISAAPLFIANLVQKLFYTAPAVFKPLLSAVAKFFRKLSGAAQAITLRTEKMPATEAPQSPVKPQKFPKPSFFKRFARPQPAAATAEEEYVEELDFNGPPEQTVPGEPAPANPAAPGGAPETLPPAGAQGNAPPAAAEMEPAASAAAEAGPDLSLEELEIEKIEKPKGIDYETMLRQAIESYEMPPIDLLHEDETESKVSREELMANADLLENTLGQFNVKAFVKKVIEGPVITLYAVRPAEGVKINQIVSLADDLALAMRAKGIRMIAPIPGEAAIGIEIPNRKPSTVYFKSIVNSEKFKNHHGELVLGMGKTIGGEVFCADLTRMPHLLIAGATGSGKSVGINTMITSILYRVSPADVKFVLIDPKKLELTQYARLKDHYLAYCPDIDEIVITHPQNAILILRAVINEMEERYDMLARVGVRDIVSYNKKIRLFEETGQNPDGFRKLPYLVVIIDELADLILTAAREVEEPITRLAQMARAVGIHLIVATQRPSVDILTGLIKANFPTRIAYQVATRPDSKVILDMYGAEKLIGNGDMLFLPPGTGKPVRLQNPYISSEDIEATIKHIRRQPKFPPYELKLFREREEASVEATKKFQQDDLFEKAKEIVIRHQQGSVSLLQRKLKVGYARAGRLMDELEQAGVVGPGQGSKPRDVLLTSFNDDMKKK